MKTLEEIRAIIRQHQPELRERYGVTVAGLFGSYVRGDQRPDSDLDVLVDIVRPISLFELVGAEIYLEELLQIDVDIVPQRTLREELRDSILAEALPL